MRCPSGRVRQSIATRAVSAQDRLEPILQNKAIELGADVRLSTQLASFEQDTTDVTAVLRHRDGRERTLRADYNLADDP